MKYKYVYRISPSKDLTIEQLSKVFPENFSIVKEDGGLDLIVEILNPSSDDEVFYQVQRECDRIYFLTGEQLNPKLNTRENPNGSRTVTVITEHLYHIFNRLPPNLDREQWENKPLGIQLRLWHFANLPETPLPAKINLLFQIIEATYPDKSDYPKYEDPRDPPNPRTEAKLLRDFVSHQQNQIRNDQLKLYCQHFKINEGFFNPTNTDHIKIVKQRLNIVRDEAKKVINDSIKKIP